MDVDNDPLWDAEPFELDDPAHTGLLIAVGRLALASADAEASLRSAVYWTCYFGDNISMMLEGESADWLLEKVRMLCKAAYGNDEVFREHYSALKGLFARRNRFMHSEYHATPGGQYGTLVSKRHYEEVRMVPCSVAEIEKLAQDLVTTSRAAVRSICQATDARIERNRAKAAASTTTTPG